jgi:regulator of sigma D
MLDANRTGSIGDPAFELYQLFNAFNQIVGQFLNGYGFNDPDHTATVFEQVKNEVPNIIPFWQVYSNIFFIEDSYLEQENAARIKELEEIIVYIKTYKDEILQQRIANGIQDRH